MVLKALRIFGAELRCGEWRSPSSQCYVGVACYARRAHGAEAVSAHAGNARSRTIPRLPSILVEAPSTLRVLADNGIIDRGTKIGE